MKLSMVQGVRMMVERDMVTDRRVLLGTLFLLSSLIAGATIGCSVAASSNGTPPSNAAPNNYFAPIVAGAVNSAGTTNSPVGFLIDHTATSYGETTFATITPGFGYSLLSSGTYTPLARGLLSLSQTYAPSSSAPYYTTYDPPMTGAYAVELAGQAGGFLNPINTSVYPIGSASATVLPLGSTEACPNYSTPKVFQFVTLPMPVILNTTTPGSGHWIPSLETAFGRVTIGTDGSVINFTNNQQFTFPTTNGTLKYPVPGPVVGACSPTVYGNAISAPNPVPLSSGTNIPEVVGQQATIAIGSSGMLVENNNFSSTTNQSNDLPYLNLMGAGTGAVGLSQPAQPMDTSALAGAQYLGFTLTPGSGAYSYYGYSSLVSSFGFPAVPSACASLAPPATTLIYGGDFTGNNPAATTVQAAGGYGNCDLAIDLGVQDPSNNGTYPAATVYVGSSYPANSTGKVVALPAVAVAGALGGKFAIFLIGLGTLNVNAGPQAIGIYLLQSN